jgi:hypothetical protein
VDAIAKQVERLAVYGIKMKSRAKSPQLKGGWRGSIPDCFGGPEQHPAALYENRIRAYPVRKFRLLLKVGNETICRCGWHREIHAAVDQ